MFAVIAFLKSIVLFFIIFILKPQILRSTVIFKFIIKYAKDETVTLKYFLKDGSKINSI